MARILRWIVFSDRIHEYDLSRDCPRIDNPHELVYPKNSSDSYYKLGDYILTSKEEPRYLAKKYREFVEVEGFSWTKVILALADVDLPTTMMKLIAIHKDGPNASVRLQPFLRISETDLVPLTKHDGSSWIDLGSHQLNADLQINYMVSVLEGWIPIGKVVTEFCIPTGIGTSAARAVIGPLTRRFGRRALAALMKACGKKALRRFAIAAAEESFGFLKDVAKHAANSISAKYYDDIQARGRPDPAFAHNIDLKPILTQAIVVGLADHVGDRVAESLAKSASTTSNEPPDWEDILPPDIKRKLKAHYTRRLVTVLVDAFVGLTKEMLVAITAYEDERKFDQLFFPGLLKKLKEKYNTQTLVDIFKAEFTTLLSAPESMLVGQ
ncbi:MAG: hypothetical protein KA791_14225 [Flavobacteriales bacterium]|nr:hypothetical protein [Flavobacteriales bacterium]